MSQQSRRRVVRSVSTEVALGIALVLGAFVVVLHSETQVSAASSASFVPLAPSRLLDTRAGVKVGAAGGLGSPLTLNVLNRGGLPGGGIGAVALNVTVTETENPDVGGGYVTVYACGTRPNTSNLNFIAGQTIANSVIAPVSAAGDVCFFVYGTAHLLVDVSGYFPTGTGYTALEPSRLLDTRAGVKVGAAGGLGSPLTLNVLNRGGLPGGGIGAVALNVTVTETENPDVGGGYVTVYACGTRPNTSNLNFIAGQTIANSVIAPVSAAGDVCFFVYGTAHLLVDVSGFFATGTGYTALEPSRFIDTRGANPNLEIKRGTLTGVTGPELLYVLGRAGIPDGGVDAVVLNVTVTHGENPTLGGGYINVFPCGIPPQTSTLNFTTGQTIANLAIVPTPPSGVLCYLVYGAAHVIVDIAGYFGPGVTALP